MCFDRLSLRNSPSKNMPKLGLTTVLTSSSNLTPLITLATLPPQEALMPLELRPSTPWLTRWEIYLFRQIHKFTEINCYLLPVPVRCLPPLPNKACDWMSQWMQSLPPPVTKESTKTNRILPFFLLLIIVIIQIREILWSQTFSANQSSQRWVHTGVTNRKWHLFSPQKNR